jgi:2-phosphosulfolactate phosphatase
MLQIPAGSRIVLPSPNGSTLSLATGDTPTLAGCLRNAQAVTDTAKKFGEHIAIIPAGERWPDGTLRPALKDLIGAGAIIHYLNGRCSPETQAAMSAFLGAEPDLTELILQCGSGKELVARGFRDDVLLASQLNVSAGVPILQEGAFSRQLKENS